MWDGFSTRPRPRERPPSPADTWRTRPHRGSLESRRHRSARHVADVAMLAVDGVVELAHRRFVEDAFERGEHGGSGLALLGDRGTPDQRGVVRREEIAVI